MARYRIGKEKRWSDWHEEWILSYYISMKFYSAQNLPEAIRTKQHLLQIDREKRNKEKLK